MIIFFALSGCANSGHQSQLSHVPRDLGSKKKEFYVEKVSLQSYNIKYFGKPSISAEDGLINWQKKVLELCKNKKSESTILKNEAVSYIRRGSDTPNAFPSDGLTVPICATGGAVDCTLVTLLTNPDTHRNYRLVEGQALCR